MSGDCGSVSSVLVCWSLDLGSTPDRNLSFSFPLDFFSLYKSTSMANIGFNVGLCAQGSTKIKFNISGYLNTCVFKEGGYGRSKCDSFQSGRSFETLTK